MIVLDVNVAIEVALDTPDGKTFRNDIDNEFVYAPKMFFAEAANVVWQYRVFGNVQIDEAVVLENACSLVDEFIDDEYLLVEALHEAVECKHSVYDMLYLVLARRNGAHLYTLDKRLQDLCQQKGVNCIQTLELPD